MIVQQMSLRLHVQLYSSSARDLEGSIQKNVTCWWLGGGDGYHTLHFILNTGHF